MPAAGYLDIQVENQGVPHMWVRIRDANGAHVGEYGLGPYSNSNPDPSTPATESIWLSASNFNNGRGSIHGVDHGTQLINKYNYKSFPNAAPGFEYTLKSIDLNETQYNAAVAAANAAESDPNIGYSFADDNMCVNFTDAIMQASGLGSLVNYLTADDMQTIHTGITDDAGLISLAQVVKFTFGDALNGIAESIPAAVGVEVVVEVFDTVEDAFREVSSFVSFIGEALVSALPDKLRFSFKDETVTVREYVGNATVIKTWDNPERSGEPALNVEFGEDVISFEKIGSRIGSVLANQIADGNLLQSVALSAVFQTALETVGEVIDLRGTSSILTAVGKGPFSIEGAFDFAISDIGGLHGALLNNVKSAGLGALASLLTVELMDAIGLEGLPGDMLSSLTNTAFTAAFDGIIEAGGVSQWYNSLSTTQSGAQQITMGTHLASALGGIAGGYLANRINMPETTEGQLGSALGGAIAGYVGYTLAVGANAFLPVVGTAIGTFLGTLLGGLIGDMFGDDETPRAGAEVKFDATTGKFYIGNIWAEEGGSYQVAEAMGNSAKDTLNSILAQVNGTILNKEAIHTGSYGHHEGDLAYFGDEDLASKFGSEAKDVLGYGALGNLKDVQIAGGDVYAKRAFYATLEGFTVNSEAETVDEVINGVLTPYTRELIDTENGLDAALGNMAVAAEYQEYLKHHAVINSIMAENPNSAFTIGWLITILQASQLGLDVRHNFDWYGGWKAWLEDQGLDSPSLSFGFDRFGRMTEGKNTANEDVAYSDTISADGKEKLVTGGANGRIVIEGDEIKELTNAAGFSGVSFAVGDKIKIAPYLVGGAGSDFLQGGDKGADIVAGGGDDVAVGGALDDWLLGGTGDDKLIAGGGEGDYLNGEAGDDLLEGDDASDWLEGGDGNDLLRARGGGDILRGGKGTDTLEGGEGGDIYHYAAGDGIDYLKDTGITTDTDEIRLKDLTLAQLSFYLSSSDDDLFIKAGPAASDWLVIEDATSDALRTIERLVDKDGNVITLSHMLALAQDSDAAGVSLPGNTNAETLDGGLHDDTLTGAGGDDTLQGNAGADIYLFSAGGGNDVIKENGLRHDVDTLVLGSGLTNPALVRGEYDTGEIRLDFGANGSITLQGVDRGSEHAIESIRFADNSSWTLYDLQRNYLTAAATTADVITGFRGDDVILAGDGNDTLNGGEGNDFLDAGRGNNSYVYHLGHGHDSIKKNYSTADTLVFETGIAAENIIFHRSWENNDLNLSFNNASGSVYIKDQFLSSGYSSVGTFAFTDGTTTSWNYQQQMQTQLAQHISSAGEMVMGGYGTDSIAALAGNDSVRSGNGNDTIIGGAGNDFLEGEDGNDTYIYNPGDGNDFIKEEFSDTDVLAFGSGIAAGNIVFHRNWSDNSLNLSFNHMNGSVHMEEQFYSSGYYNIKTITFTDGTTASWNYQSLIQAQLAQHVSSAGEMVMGGYGADSIAALAGDDSIYAGDGNDTITGGTGNDFIQGGRGGDAYVYYLGDGHDRIKEDYFETDTLTFGSGIAADNIVFHRDWGNGSVVLSFNNAAGSIYVDSQFNNNGYESIENVVFTSGATTSWNYQSLMQAQLAQHISSAGEMVLGGHGADTINALQGDDSVQAGEGDDVLTGAVGNDFLEGGSGNDTYTYNAGDGHDTIYDSYSSGDTLVFGSGIDVDNLVIHQLPYYSSSSWVQYHHLLITFNNMDGSVYLLNQSNSSQRIENFVLEDNGSPVTLSYNQLLANATIAPVANTILGNGDDSYTGTTAGNAIYGGNGNDTLHGATGHDRLEGSGGNDTYRFNVGDGQDIIYDIHDQNTLVFGVGILPEDIVFSANPSNDSLVLRIGNTNDAVIIENFDAIATFVFTESGASFSRTEFMESYYLAAEATADYIKGTGYAETILGGAGDDAIYTKGGNDAITGGTGNDRLNGDSGNDTYYFNAGDGQDVIDDIHGDNHLVFGVGITSADISLSSNPHDRSLILHIGNNGDSVTLLAYGTIDRMVDFTFSGTGGTLSLGELTERLYLAAETTSDYLHGTGYGESISGGAGDDIVYANGGNDTIYGGAGNDHLDGEVGNDTYLFNVGDGRDSIHDIHGNHHLVFGSGITLEDVTISSNPHDGSTILNIGNSGDAIVLAANATTNQLEDVTFTEDGITLTRAGLFEKLYLAARATSDYLYGTGHGEVIHGGAGDDAVHAGNGNDTLYGGAGNDHLEDGGGNDVYLFNTGDGQDVIDEFSGTDRIIFGEGIFSENIRVTRSPHNNQLVLRVDGTDDSITFIDDDTEIEAFEFADGTVWSKADMLRLVNATGTNGVKPAATWGDDFLMGTTGEDTLEGTLDDDTLQGGAGADTYRYTYGDGRDVIYDSGLVTDTDRLVLTGITSAEVAISVSMADADDLILTIGTNGDSIYLDEQKNGRGVERIEFADGIVWLASGINAASGSINATSGNDLLFGSAGADSINAGNGDDTVYGGAGGDTYYYSNGNGSDTIIDMGSDTATDTLSFTDIASSAVGITYQNGDLLLTYNDATILVKQQSQGNHFGIETFSFSNGVSLSANDMEQLYLGQLVTSGNDNINGFASDDTLQGGAGADTLSGGAGSDDYLYNNGDGNDIIIDNGNAGETDRLMLGSGINPEDISVTFSSNRQDLVLHVNGAGSITLQNILLSEYSGIEQTPLHNGTILDKNIILQLAFDALITSGADTVTGTDLGDTIAVLAGNDTVSASSGNDTVDGGEGDDNLKGDFGDDILQGGSGNDALSGGFGNDTLTGGTGNDTLSGGAGYDTFIFGVQSGAGDIITDFIRNDDIINLTALTHITFFNHLVITDDNGTAVINLGNSQTLRLQGTAASSLTATDFVFAEPLNATIEGSAGNDTIAGGAGSEEFQGYNGNDIIYGNAGNDTVYGGGGDDTLIGGLGADVLKGDGGADIFRFTSRAESTPVSYDIINQIKFTEGDKIDLTGLGFSDLREGYGTGNILGWYQETSKKITLFADGFTLMMNFPAAVEGITLTDLIGVGSGYAVTHQGTNGNDVLTGTSGNDGLAGGSGNDTLDGGSGNDVLDGGALADVLKGRAGADIYFYDELSDSSGAGNDLIQYWDSADKIDVRYLGFTGVQAGAGDGSVLGWYQSGSYTYVSDTGEFWIRISGTHTLTAENFIFSGGPGFSDENYVGTSGADSYIAGQGNDTLDGGAGNDTLGGGVGHNKLYGGIDHDTLYGGLGNDTLTGDDGFDRLEGQDGNDLIIGGLRNDWLVGGVGADIFAYYNASHSNTTYSDVISDFEHGIDTIDIGALGYTTLVATSNPTGTELGYYDDGLGHTVLIGALNGGFRIFLNGSPTVDANDFDFT